MYLREESLDSCLLDKGEWGLDDKFKPQELVTMFRQLAVDEEQEQPGPGALEMASCAIFMQRLTRVHADHPNYSARKAVYRVCRRLLRAADAK